VKPPKDKPYVYALADPTGVMFYIGKGRGDRCFQHVRQAKRGKPGAKCDRIREILAAGEQVEHLILGVFRTDEEAAAAEVEWIAKHYEALTNQTKGGEMGCSEKLLRRYAIKRAKALLSRLMPFDKWVASLSEERKRQLVEQSGGESLWEQWSFIYNGALRETMDPRPNWAKQMPDGSVSFSFGPPPPTLPMPKWTKVFDGATGEWEIQYG